MNNLIKQAKIYMLYDNTNGNVYYGSTTLTLNKRLSRHKKQNNSCISKEIIDNNDYIIKEIETIYYIHFDKVLWRERWYIQKYPCINERLPIQTYEERKEQKKKYNKEHKEQIKEYKKDYDKEHKEKKKKYQKEYRELNKDKILEKIKCECGAVITKCNLIRHKKSNNHKKYINP